MPKGWTLTPMGADLASLGRKKSHRKGRGNDSTGLGLAGQGRGQAAVPRYREGWCVVWQAFVVIGGMVLAIGFKVAIEWIKIQEVRAAEEEERRMR